MARMGVPGCHRTGKGVQHALSANCERLEDWHWGERTVHPTVENFTPGRVVCCE